MKKSIKINCALIISMIWGMSVFAQTQEFDVKGLKVIYKAVPKQIVSARLFVQGGTANYPLEQSGIEDFAFRLAVTGGTTSMDKLTFSTALEQMGTTISAGTAYDYGQISMKCVKQNWDASWTLFVETILHPAFDEQQYQLLQDQLIAEAKQNESDPDESLIQAAMANVFAGKNYEKNPSGHAESLAQLSLEDLKKYYTQTVGKERSFLVIVGDLDVNALKKKIAASLSKLPKGTMPPVEDRNMLGEISNKIKDRDIATNYMAGIMSAPTLASEDGTAMMIAMSILSERYFVELRTKRSLSYAPYAYYDNGKVTNPFNLIYISTTDPKQSIQVMVDEISKLKKEGFSEKELKNKKQKYLTQFYMGQETLDSQSQSLGTNELKGGWEMAENFTERVNAVTLEDINRVIDKYSDIISWTYLGKADMVSEEDFLQPSKVPADAKVESTK
ncbi:insulinase family protein [Reichenbachiella carrageenanivorans]|uniref:Insulinase family protein n=1 Tax=Reichenbachiella carrageenanivorans TaxID=2979869 RepID=A0ABY6CZY8_9BACT|nr:pitrilysin family protein [Reichenbachiella carrageenanivorans]UXX79476.1 insulinase family protein [Reichenbachiella carrageenanivorans]